MRERPPGPRRTSQGPTGVIPDGQGHAVPGTIGGMSETPTSGLGDDLRGLRRSRDDRVVAGVLGGVARRLNVDPLLLRIVTVVLAIFGGVGVVLYALGWLLIPDEDVDGSVAEQALGRGGNRSPEMATVALAVALVIAVLIAAGGTFRSGIGSLLLVLAVVGAAMLLRRRDDGTVEPHPDGHPAYPGFPVDPEYPGYPGHPEDAAAHGTQPGQPADRVVPTEPGAPDSTTSTIPQPPAAEPVETVPASEAPAGTPAAAGAPGAAAGPAGSGWPEGPDWEPPTVEPLFPAAPPERPTRRRSILGPVTISAVAVAMGILAVNDATWASIPVSAYIATALAIVGLGLLVGAWFGRSRGLIWLGLVLAMALPPAVLVADGLDLSADRTNVVMTSIAEVPDEPRNHGTGQVTYDLSQLELADDDEITLVISQSIGQLRVIVPPEADVHLTASANLGEVTAFDAMSGGFQPSRTIVDLGPDGEGGGSITLELELGVGQIEVTR